MSVSGETVRELRRERGWSQEQLAKISGVSERTIQRIETDGSCSLDSKMALASAFELPPSALSPKATELEGTPQLTTDWAGAVGLFVCGLLAPVVVALTATNPAWEIAALSIVLGLTILLSVMTQGARATWHFFDRTSWIVRYPTHAIGLNGMISHARMIVSTVYAVGLFASVVTGLAIAIYGSGWPHPPIALAAIVLKPSIYAALFAELWIRPFKRKLQRMLASQLPPQLTSAPEHAGRLESDRRAM